jgi:hypothetical protein
VAAAADVEHVLVGEEELARLCLDLTAIPSPTGV